MEARPHKSTVVVACPDARPPAYQAAIALGRAGLLERFLTSSYYNPEGIFPAVARRLARGSYARIERFLLRRHHEELPARRVSAVPSVDLALWLENRCVGRSSVLRRRIAQLRTGWFDRRLAHMIRQQHPGAVLVFSDVGSAITLPVCRKLGIPTILSMVHGDVREEAEVIREEAALAPDFFPIYLGDGTIDPLELSWLYRRRLCDLEMADYILVPSEHIASTLVKQGIPRDRIQVLPYAADSRRFHPLKDKRHDLNCTFLFAGGITQRKGIKYLLQAWSRIRRPGWKLQLLGPMPRNRTPLLPWLEQVEILGRVAHADMPAVMAAADVFVFPSLFEGSAVVTYEAIACGLPSLVTPASGSVVRDGVEGFVIPPRNVEELAQRMELLGNSPDLRARMAQAARERACQFDWPRYHAGVVSAVKQVAWQAGKPIAESIVPGSLPGRHALLVR